MPRARTRPSPASAATSLASRTPGVVKRVHGGALAVQPRDHLLDYDWQRERRRTRSTASASAPRPSSKTTRRSSSTAVRRWPRWPAPRRPLAARHHQLARRSRRILRDSRNIDVTLTGGYLFPRLEIVLGPLCEHMLASGGRRRAGDGDRRRDGGRLQQQQHPASSAPSGR